MNELEMQWKEEEDLSQVNDFPFAFIPQSSVEADNSVAMKLVFLILILHHIVLSSVKKV